MTKTFRIVSVSKNANAFCLHGHVLVARDGTAFEVGRSRGSWHEEWNVGKEINVPFSSLMHPHEPKELNWAQVECEIPRELPACPANVLKEIFG